MRKRWKAARPRARIAVVVVLAVVLAGLGTGARWFLGRDPADAATAGATTTTVAASTSTMEKSVSATGTLTPTVSDNVSFAVPGTVTSVAVKEGDTVTAGQTLATVDTLSLNADLLSAKATQAQAQAKLTDLEGTADGSASSAAQIAAAKAQVTVAEAGVTTAQTNLSDATLVAPAAGLVTSVDLAVGDKVSGSGSSSSSVSSTSSSSAGSGGTSGSTSSSAGSGGTSGGASNVTGSGSSGSSSSSSSGSSGQFTIIGTGAYQTSVSVGDSDIASIAVGDQVEMTSDDLSGTVYGVVSTIGLVSTTTSGSAGYPVTITVTGGTSALHDGVSVTAKIIYQRRTDVLTVPSRAITTQNGTSYVEKVGSDGKATKTEVKTGETADSMTEITSGLAEGDKVQLTTYQVSSGRSTSGSSSRGQQQNGSNGFPGGGEMPNFQGRGDGQLPGGRG